MKTSVFTLTFLAVQTVHAQPPEAIERFEARVYEGTTGQTIGYRLLKPASIEEGESYPLVLFLHGAGERGDDNTIQLVHGMADLCSDEMMARHPCFVVAPQCPNEQKWSNVDWSLPASTQPEDPSDAMSATMAAIEALSEEFPIDQSRLYITGLSMGGYGTWDAIARYPGKFAAAIPICGGGDPAQAANMMSTAIWAFHGDEDEAVPVERSREMVQALSDSDPSTVSRIIYTEYEGVGHNSWTDTYHNRLVWDWLFAQQSLKLPGAFY